MARKTQSVVFSKESWTEDDARSWLADNDLSAGEMVESDESLAFQQFSADECAEGSAETDTEGQESGVAVISCDRMEEDADDSDTDAPTAAEEEGRSAYPMNPREMMKRQVKHYAAECRTLKSGAIEAMVSTESVDRMGDIIRAAGWDTGNFMKTGGPVLWSHSSGGMFGEALPPIGNCKSIRRVKGGLIAVTAFHEKTQLSKDIATLYRDGHMNSFSVGFQPTEQPAVRKGDNDQFLGYVFNKQELLEYSAVAVPANPDAVMCAYGEGRITRSTLSFFAGQTLPGAVFGRGAETKVVEMIERHTRNIQRVLR